MDDDGDEWRVVRVKRGASKGKTPVESAFPRGVGGHGKRENTNAFQALAGPRDDGDDEVVVAQGGENTAHPEKPLPTKRGTGGGKKQAKKMDTANDTTTTDPPSAVASNQTGSTLDVSSSLDVMPEEIGTVSKHESAPSTPFSFSSLLLAILAALRLFLNALTRGVLFRGVKEKLEGNKETIVTRCVTDVPGKDQSKKQDLSAAREGEVSGETKKENSRRRSAGGDPDVNTLGAVFSTPGESSFGFSEARGRDEQENPNPRTASAPLRLVEKGFSVRRISVRPGQEKGHAELVRSVSMSGDGSSFVTGGWDGCVRRWRLLSGDLHDSLVAGPPLLAHADRCEFVDMMSSSNGSDGCDGGNGLQKNLLVTGGRDCSLRMYDLGNELPSPVRKIYTYESISAGCVDWCGGGSHSNGKTPTAALGTRGGALSFWDVETGGKKNEIKNAHDGEVSFVSCFGNAGNGAGDSSSGTPSSFFSGLSFMSGGADGLVRVWDTRVDSGSADRCVFAFGGHRGRVYHATSDGISKLFAGDHSGAVKVHDLRRVSKEKGSAPDVGTSGPTIRKPSTKINVVPSFASGGARAPIAGVHYAKTPKNTETENVRSVLFATAAYFDETSESPKGCVRVLSLGDDDDDFTRNITSRELATLPSGGGLISASAVTTDGNVCVAGDVNGGVTVWRRESEKKEGGERFPESIGGDDEPNPSAKDSVGDSGRWESATAFAARLGFGEGDEETRAGDTESDDE